FTTDTLNDLRGAGWVHCALVVPSGATVSQLTAYLNGQPATPVIEPANSGNTLIQTGTENDVTLGRMADNSALRSFAGRLDDVRIYSRALDADEVSAIAAETSVHNHRNQWRHRNGGGSSTDTSYWSI